jgi:NADPH2:quinone reductase
VKAIQFAATGGPEVLQLVDLPVPEPGPGQIRVHQHVAGVNFIDIYIRTGRYARTLPHVPGREGAGTVDALGAGVTNVQIGDRISYSDDSVPGGYAEYAVIPAASAVVLPKDITFETACALTLQGLTAHYLATSSYPIERGDWVLIHAGAGGVGRLLIQLAKARGATVVATAGSPEKIALALSGGADHAIDYTQTDFAAEALRLAGGKNFAAVYDSVGKDTFDGSMSLVRPRGSLVLYGASSGAVPPLDPIRLMAGSISLSRPTLADFIRTPEELAMRSHQLFAAVENGSLDVRVGATYPLAQAAQAQIDLAARKTTGKVLLTISSGWSRR